MRQHTIRWQLPYASLGEFISSHHAFVTQSGLYFKTATTLPLGAEAEFSITLDDGEEIISGKGRVAEVHVAGGGGPGGLAGVMLQFTDLSPQYNEVLLLIAAHRAVLDARRVPGTAPKIREGLPDAVLGFDEPGATAVPASFATTSSAAPAYASPNVQSGSSPRRDADDVAEEFFSSAPKSAPVGPPMPPPATSMAVPVAPLPNEPKVPASVEPKGTPPLPPEDHGEVSVTTPAGAIAGYAIDPSALAPEAGEVSGAARVGSTPPAQGMPVMRFSGEVQSVRTKMSAEALSRVPRGDRPLPPPVGPIIGIDLGTTNTCASVVEGGRPIVIPSRRGYSTIPSMVALNEYGNLLVGHMARSQFLLNPVNTVYGAKRLIGRKFKSPLIQGLKNIFNYEVVEAPDGSTAVRLGGQVLTMPQVSALILMEIREIAQEYLQTPVNRAVISVPAYYNDSQRNAVRDAGRLAGFHVERIVNEPTAAALAYGFDKGLSQRIFVYDLGGGTFDASVLQLEGDVYEVLSTGGNNFLGGIDFDNRLADYFDEVFRSQHGVGLPRDGVTAQRVLFAAEQAKIALSDQPSYDVHVPYLMMHEGKSLDLKLTVTQQKLNELTDDLITRTLGVADGVLSARNIEPSSLDTILLVGGQSRLPRIRGRLAEHFARPIGKGVHPDESVALGAALLAHSLQRADAGLLLIDVLPISIGLALPDGRYARIIPRNTKLPSQKTFTIATTRDLQSEMTLVVLQGENDRYGDNDYLGTLRFDGITPAPMGKNQLRVTFAISNESTLTVTAFDGLSGKEIHATMTMRDAPEEVSMPRYGRPSGTAVEMVAIEATFPGKISDNPQRPATMRAPVLGGGSASTLPGGNVKAAGEASGARRNLSAEELFGVSSDAAPMAVAGAMGSSGAEAGVAQERAGSSMPVVSPAASVAVSGEKPRPSSDLFDLEDDEKKKKPGFWARMFGGKRNED